MKTATDTPAQTGEKDLFDQAFLARLERLHMIAKRTLTGPQAGMRRSKRIGDGLEFADHRDYAPGDDVRFVDWPYFARMEKLLLRMFHEHSEADVTILFDRSDSMTPAGDNAKFDYARRTAAALAYVAMGGPQHVNIVPFSDRLSVGMTASRNRSQVLEVLRFLTAVETTGGTQLAQCAEQFAKKVTSPGTVLILSDLLDCAEQLPDTLAHLKLHGHDVAVLHLHTPQDAQPQLVGPMLLTQAEGVGRLSINVTPELIESYRTQWDDFCSACEASCVARESIYVSACTDVPFDQLILHTLRAAGVLGT